MNFADITSNFPQEDQSNEDYVKDAPALGYAIQMRGHYTVPELEQALAKLREANSYAGQGSVRVVETARGFRILHSAKGWLPCTCISRAGARLEIENLTGVYGDEAVIPQEFNK